MQADTRSDDEFMEEFNKCNDGVLSIIVARHYNALVGYLYARIFGPSMGFGNEAMDASRDVAQDVWERVVNRKGNYKPGRAKFTTWLYKIGINLALNELRRRKRFARDTAKGQD